METTIRRASGEDLPALTALARRTIEACYSAFLGHEAVTGFLGSGAADRYVEDNLTACEVIVVDGVIVGLSVCRDDTIDLMMIDRERHRQGLGAKLLAHCEASLFRVHPTLRLESFAGNRNANAFYRSMGWRESGRYDDPASGLAKIMFTRDRLDRAK